MESMKNVPHGHRLVPKLIDEIAIEAPEKVFASLPKSATLEDGYIDITYQDLSRAINRAAIFLDENFSRSASFETLAYLGPFDLRYTIFVCAAPKIGYKASRIQLTYVFSQGVTDE